ncbi:MAG TPA: M20 aminoacylase family protein [Thermoanaerobaculia bacterium]|nr:M20 aminoacylase family protein [Thermoanaerobaculia bacterium]
MTTGTAPTTTAADRRIEDFAAELVAWRRDLHRHPELAFQETRTSDLVAERLESFEIEVHRGLARTGVVGVLRAGSSERAIGLRADMDALPIREANDFEHRSAHEGVMHACGHDGHTTMLLGAARYLAETRGFDGTVYFIFQPAEELGGGGEVMVKEGLFERFPAEQVYGMHNFPGMPAGDFGLCAGPMLAAADMIEMTVECSGGHAAMPHLGADGVLVATQVVQALQAIVARNVDPIDNAVISITTIHGGDAFNVMPARIEMTGCVRTFRESVQELIERRIREIGEAICAAHGARFELRYRRTYPATVNTEDEVQRAAAAASEVGHRVDAEMRPIMGSEDFSFMLRERPGAFIGIGNGPSAALHTPRYDFNDEILALGARYWARLVERELPPGVLD